MKISASSPLELEGMTQDILFLLILSQASEQVPVETAHLEPGVAGLEIDRDKHAGVSWGWGAKAEEGGPPG